MPGGTAPRARSWISERRHPIQRRDHRMELEGIVSKRIGSVCERQDTRLAEHEEPGILEREDSMPNLASGTSQPRNGNRATSNLLPSMLQALERESPPS